MTDSDDLSALIDELETGWVDEHPPRDDLLRYEGAATERAKVVSWLIANGLPGQAGAIHEGSHYGTNPPAWSTRLDEAERG